MSISLNGLTGSLTWGYHAAGTVDRWSVERGDDGWTLTGTLAHGDTFRLSQRPLVFLAPHLKGAWRWPVIELQISGAALSARLGSRET